MRYNSNGGNTIEEFKSTYDNSIRMPADWGIKNTNINYNDKKKSNNITLYSIFTIIWLIMGILGWIMSIYCFKNKGKTENVLGLLIATLLGPFFWLYYIYMDNYCGKK